jgi:hypothetical protein
LRPWLATRVVSYPNAGNKGFSYNDRYITRTLLDFLFAARGAAEGNQNQCFVVQVSDEIRKSRRRLGIGIFQSFGRF